MRQEFCILCITCIGILVAGSPLDLGTQVQVYTKPTIEKIVIHVQRRMADIWDFWQINSNLCPPSLCVSDDGEGSRPKPRGTGGSVFYNGDIVLVKADEEYIFGDDTENRRKRAAVKPRSRLWPFGIVKYKWASDIDPKSKKTIKAAMKHISEISCVRFQNAKEKDEDYVRFISEPGCWSNIGRVGGEQKLSIGRGCNEVVGVAVHELLHALGFWHEQSRPDRDDYVEVHLENVAPRYLEDFKKLNKSLINSRGYPYDYLSIMHYKEYTFTNTGEQTIVVKGIGEKLRMLIGQRVEMSNIDIAQLRDVYHCHQKQDANETTCFPGWIKFKTSCYKFFKRPKYQFAAAVKYCSGFNSYLAHVNDIHEDKFLKKYVARHFNNTLRWRVGGRKINGTFYWYTDDDLLEMKFIDWATGHPSKYTSMILEKHNKTSDVVTWKGAWSGSRKDYPKDSFAFICERPAKRKCIDGDYKDGREYRGNLDHTISGIYCQNWTLQYPHQHNVLPKGPLETDPDGLGEHNYCRNPSKLRRNRPWCFTTKSKREWEYCDVNICTKTSNEVPAKNSQYQTTRYRRG